MICKAKHPGVCYGCNAPILVGQLIDWNFGMQSARHAGCQTEHQKSISTWDHDRDHLWDRQEREPDGQLCAAGCGTRLYGYRGVATCENCKENQRIRELLTRLDGDGEHWGSGSQTRTSARASVNENPSPSHDSPEVVIEDAQRAHRVMR